MRPSYSIARWLIATILLVELLSACGVAGVALLYDRHERFQAFDVMLRGRADSLLGAVQDAEDAQDNVMLDGTETSLPREDVYVVMGTEGRLLGLSPNWTREAAEDALRQEGRPVRGRRHEQPGELFLQIHSGGRRYRAVRIEGLRMVDPGDPGGGIPRRVTIVYGAPIGPVKAALRRAAWFYGLTSLAAIVVTGLLMAWALRRGLAPLDELTAEASGVSVRSWEFVPSERVLATRELAPLAGALSNVLEGLKASFVERDRFVSDAAHELKTAVAVVKSSLQLMTMRRRTVEEYEAGLERAQVDCERMEGIVAKMLLLARIEDENAAASKRGESRCSLADAVRCVVEELMPMAEARGVTLVVQANRPLAVAADAEQVRLVCANLVQNAIPHSLPGASVLLVIEERDGMAELRVEDRGEGIAADDLPHVFERFFRSDPSRSRSTGGTGLGLAICKAIVDGLHGTISIASEPGVGTTVTVRLPKAAA